MLPDWHDDAACRNYDGALWFPTRGQSSEPAKKICAGCPVREKCLEFAERNLLKHGVWGGLSENQRKRRRKGRRAFCAACGIEIAVSPTGTRCDPCRREARRERGRLRYVSRAAIERRTA